MSEKRTETKMEVMVQNQLHESDEAWKITVFALAGLWRQTH
jgi:hypothetical protein